MARRKRRRIPKMNKVQKLLFIALNLVAFGLLGVVAMNTILQFDWNGWLMALLSILTAAWLMVQGGLNVLINMKGRMQPKAFLHVISFGIGFVLLFIGILSIPPIGNLVNMSRFAIPIAMVMFASMVFAALEIFI